MQDPLRLTLISLVVLVYFLQEGLCWLDFKKRYHQNPNRLGHKAQDDLQRFYGQSILLVAIYYLIIYLHLFTGFDYWGALGIMPLLVNRPSLLIGFVSANLFIVAIYFARQALGASWRMGIDFHTRAPLVTRGLYAHIRNPYFTFLLGFQGALILMVPCSVALFAFLQSLVVINFQVRLEESFLGRHYQEAFDHYRDRVGRFFPRLWWQKKEKD